MPVTDGSALVVVGASTRGLCQSGECPPVAAIAETFVADFARFDVVRTPRCDGDRRSPSEGTQARCSAESLRIVADFGKQLCSENRTASRC